MDQRLASTHNESKALRSISRDPARFFTSVWQQSCAIFSVAPTNGTTTIDNENDPLGELVREGWQVLLSLLQAARRIDEHDTIFKPLFFKDQCSLSPDDRAIYDSSCFAAYLDGCSVVINHADRYSRQIAELCNDLQQSFPHAYANTYLTPPESQAVPAHADDRDVFVIQVLGSKHWKVYKKIPVPFPYPEEQVGKEGLVVPPQVLEDEVLIDRVLRPGDVLYMPRGYVHQARATSEFSFHATVALATHDWSLAGIMSSATERLLKSIVDLRMAVPVEFGTRDWNDISDEAKHGLQSQIDGAIEELRHELTAQTVHEILQRKFQWHNKRVKPVRDALLASETTGQSSAKVVGPEAAERVTLTTRLRAATEVEKASLEAPRQPRGLHVREPNYPAIMSILSQLKSGKQCRVVDLRSLLGNDVESEDLASELLCDLTLVCFARQCVELGALAIVDDL